MARPEPIPARPHTPSIDEILAALAASGVLDTFLRLSKDDQANFLRWIGSTDDPEIRSRRTETFVSALQAAPLGPEGWPREAGGLSP